jgi:hypothetical protein
VRQLVSNQGFAPVRDSKACMLALCAVAAAIHILSLVILLLEYSNHIPDAHAQATHCLPTRPCSSP